MLEKNISRSEFTQAGSEFVDIFFFLFEDQDLCYVRLEKIKVKRRDIIRVKCHSGNHRVFCCGLIFFKKWDFSTNVQFPLL